MADARRGDERPRLSPFHGPERLYASDYSEEELREWADRIKGWRAEGREVFAYFNDDEMGYAPRNALRLRELASA